MTQVPPRRYSSASITRAPCCAAMRAARTPPEPPPMTNRSTSKSDMLHIVSALLHFSAHAVHDVDRQIVGPFGGAVHRVFDGLRLLDDHLLADRRLVKGQNLLQLWLGEMGGIGARGAVDHLAGAAVEFLVHLRGDFVDVLRPHEIRLHDDAL